MEIKYGKLIYSDIPHLMDLRIKQLKDEGANATCDITKYLKEYYVKQIPSNSFTGFVAESANSLIGTSGLSFVSKPPWYGNLTGKIGLLSSVFVEEKYRRQGIATKLLLLIIEEAKANGCNQVHVTASKDGAELYQSLDFVKKDNFLIYSIS